MVRMCIVFTCVFFLGLVTVTAQSAVFTEVSNDVGIVDAENFIVFFGSGASVVDYDGDGDLDIFAGTEGGQNNQLYRNLGNGQFEETASALGLTSTARARTGLWFDYNGDQLLDLFILGDCYPQGCIDSIVPLLYEQTESGTFIDVTVAANIDFGKKYETPDDKAVGGTSVADINNDGYLDILVSVWGGEFTLFLNNSDGTFTDISIASGLGGFPDRRWQPIFFDFNQDGYMDFYCNKDFGANELMINNGDNTFSDIASEIGANTAFNEMGMTLGDYDNDGDMDIYATNISREDGGVLRHNVLLNNAWAQTNTLSFTDVSSSGGVGASGWDWGTTFFDADNDGKLDLAITNGWAPKNHDDDNSKFWLNLGDGVFSDNSINSNFNDALDAATLVAFDMDRDGDLDLLQSLKENIGETKVLKLYQNQHQSTANPGNYLVVKPRMNTANHFAIGAVVKVTTGDVTRMRPITAGTSYYGQEPAEAFFGLGADAVVDEIRIEWPDNTVTIVQDVAINQIITITNDNLLDVTEIQKAITKIYPNPTKNVLHIQSEEIITSIRVYNILGQELITQLGEVLKVDVDVSELQSGVYFVKTTLLDNRVFETYQFIKK